MSTNHFSVIAFLMILCTPLFSQKKKPGNYFDSAYAKKHEISAVIIMSRGSSFLGLMGTGPGGGFSVEYARVYKYNHFLRTGVRTLFADNDYYPSSTIQLTPTPNFGSGNEDYTMLKTNTNSSISSQYTGAFIGYEYGIGRRKFRFTFGADLHVGYNHRRVNTTEDKYIETRTLNPVTGLYDYNIQYQSTGNITGISRNIFLGISPRLGVRREFGKHFALAFTFTPQIGYSQRLDYTEHGIGTRPDNYFNPKSTWYDLANADLRFIFKIGKRIPKQ